MWSILLHPTSGTFVGVAIALAMIVIYTPNPASIPIRRYFIKALPGLLLFIITWSVFAKLAFIALKKGPVNVFGDSQESNWYLAVALGLLAPQIRQVKRLINFRKLTPTSAYAIKILQWVDESTALYLAKIINREERKIGIELMRMDNHCAIAIDGLFELHKWEIALQLARRLPTTEEFKVYDIFYVHCMEIKLRYLLRHLGQRDLSTAVRMLHASPELLSPLWPPRLRDRRQGRDRRERSRITLPHNPEQRTLPHGRRRTDSEFVRRIISNGIEGPLG